MTTLCGVHDCMQHFLGCCTRTTHHRALSHLPDAAFHFHSGISHLASVLLAAWVGQSLWWVWSLGTSPQHCLTDYPSNTSSLSPAVLFSASSLRPPPPQLCLRLLERISGPLQRSGHLRASPQRARLESAASQHG